MSTRKNFSAPRIIPATFAVLAIVSGLVFPRIDVLYLLGHALALICAVAVPLSYAWLSRNFQPKGNMVRRFFLICLGSLAVVSASASLVLISMGSSAGASGDIGGIFLWILATATLLILSVATAVVGPQKSALPEQ